MVKLGNLKIQLISYQKLKFFFVEFLFYKIISILLKIQINYNNMYSNLNISLDNMNKVY